MKLRKPLINQLEFYLDIVEREGCYYGDVYSFKKRHEELKKFLSDLRLEGDR